MQTSGQSGRYIGTGALNNITAFGESQLLGMDWSDRNEKYPHDLTRILKNKNIVLWDSINCFILIRWIPYYHPVWKMQQG